MNPELYIVVEGHTDEAVARRICAFLDIRVANVYGKKGKDYISKNLHGFDNAAKRSKWLVIRDLDHDAECAPSLKRDFMASSQNLAICFAVREVEAWLLADSENMHSFLKLRRKKLIPDNPEVLDNPKKTLVDIARLSTSKEIREDMVPRSGSGRKEGILYSSRIVFFATNIWNPEIAMNKCPSLNYCIEELRRISGI